MANKPEVPCAVCGKLMWTSTTSLPAGQSTCTPCRRAAHGLASDQRVVRLGPALRVTKRCATCGETFIGKGSHRYCSVECGRKFRNNTRYGNKPVNTNHRGYGSKHQRIRRETIDAAYDTPCHFCGDLMLVGQSLHLDHTEDGAEYRGFAHAHCNQRDGGLRGNERRRQLVLYKAGIINELPTYATVRKAAPPPPKRIPKLRPPRWQPEWRVCAVCKNAYLATGSRQIVCSDDCRVERQRISAREGYRNSGNWQGGTWSSTRTPLAPRRTCVRCHVTYIATGPAQRWCTKACRAVSIRDADEHVRTYAHK